VKAIMGLAIGGAPVTRGVDLKNVGVPTLLLAGRLDHNSTHEVSEEAFGAISSTDKAYVLIGKATHRSFDSTYCAQMQAAAAVADKGGGPHGEPDGTLDPDEVNTWAEHAKLDWHTVQGIATSFPGGLSGKAVHYCSPDYFTTPIWIAPAVARFNPFSEVAEPLRDLGSPPSAVSSATCPAATPTVVPCTGLDTEEVKQGVTDLATTFFGTVLKSGGADGMHFTRYLAPKWLEKHIPMVDSAIAIASGKAVCPPGQEVTCAE
jgi:hypothetical protein